MPWTNASIVLNSRDATAGTYNALKFNATNQNIIQGQIHSISVNEVNFPYDIPNVQAGYNMFNLSSTTTTKILVIEIAPGFYTGTELKAAIDTEIGIQAVANSITAADAPTVSYDDVSNLFSFIAPVNPPPGNANPTWEITSPYTFPNGYPTPKPLGKDLLSIMGFLKSQAPAVVSSDPANVGEATLQAAQSAPLQFTQYVDICSPLMCQYQYFRDGSTTNLSRQSDVICRLYISNNVAIQENEGQRPFVIQRQFNNARVMRWSAESSVGQLDINLYDDIGQPLKYTWLPRPYQITFNCYEQDKDSTTY